MRILCDGVCAACRGRLQCLQNIASSRFSVVQCAHIFIVSRLSFFDLLIRHYDFSMTLKTFPFQEPLSYLSVSPSMIAVTGASGLLGAIRAANVAPAGSRYILSGHWLSIREVAGMVAQISGRRAPDGKAGPME